MTLGDLISALFDEYEKMFGCPEKAAVATAEAVNRILMGRERALHGDLGAIPTA